MTIDLDVSPGSEVEQIIDALLSSYRSAPAYGTISLLVHFVDSHLYRIENLRSESIKPAVSRASINVESNNNVSSYTGTDA
jgi:hypothetical protein